MFYMFKESLEKDFLCKLRYCNKMIKLVNICMVRQFFFCGSVSVAISQFMSKGLLTVDKLLDIRLQGKVRTFVNKAFCYSPKKTKLIPCQILLLLNYNKRSKDTTHLTPRNGNPENRVR